MPKRQVCGSSTVTLAKFNAFVHSRNRISPSQLRRTKPQPLPETSFSPIKIKFKETKGGRRPKTLVRGRGGGETVSHLLKATYNIMSMPTLSHQCDKKSETKIGHISNRKFQTIPYRLKGASPKEGVRPTCFPHMLSEETLEKNMQV